MSSNGRPEPDVIAGFQDGHSFSKRRMEEAFASGVLSEPAKKASKSIGDTKQSAEHIDIIVNELGLTRHLAERALADHKGDIVATLRALVRPPVN